MPPFPPAEIYSDFVEELAGGASPGADVDPVAELGVATGAGAAFAAASAAAFFFASAAAAASARPLSTASASTGWIL